MRFIVILIQLLTLFYTISVTPCTKLSIENSKAASLLYSSRPDWDYETICARIESLQANELSKLPCFTYPLKKVDLLFKALGKEKVTIFAYGSLLDEKSASKTLSRETMRTYQPVIVLGYSRTFDRHVERNIWKLNGQTNNTGMLNLFESDEFINGVAFQVGKQDLEALIKREKGYDLVPVVAIPWDEKRIEPFIAYAFIASIHPREGKQYTSNRIKPIPDYAQLCQTAAARWGQSFEKLWINTTYLSDRKTPYADWLNDS